MDSLPFGFNAAVIGASGGIGAAVADRLVQAGAGTVWRFSRSARGADHLSYDDESTIEGAAAQIDRPLHLVFVATGVLHDAAAGVRPEKTWRALDPAALARVHHINTIGPALVAKHFLPNLAPDARAIFAAISARVGSIEDNGLGGWHAYRASKAALNQIIKTLSIELARKNDQALCVGLHPGTVASALSEPFQRGVAPGKLFTPDHSAACMLSVLDGLPADASGGLYAWDGARIPF